MRPQYTIKKAFSILNSQFSIIIFLLCWQFAAQAQDTLAMNLQDVINRARSNSPSAAIARTRLANGYWQFKAFQSQFKPQIAMEATLPSLNRFIRPVIDQQTGQQIYLPTSYMDNSLDLYFRQMLPWTGGSAYLRAGLLRTDNFGDLNSTTYFSTPVNIGFDQPLFTFNPMKWNRKIEPLRYEEAQRQNAEELEDITVQAVSRFFDVYIAQSQLEAARTDKMSADSLYALSKGRFEVGRIAENELLQVELSVMNAETSLASATLALQSATEQLRNFLNIKDVNGFALSLPDSLPSAIIDPVKALDYARQYRSLPVGHARRNLEAERDVASAKGSNGINASLSAGFGLSQTGPTISDAYQSPLDQERIALTVTVPLATWGRAESERQIAQSNMELTQLLIEQERISFEQTVVLKVKQFSLVYRQTEIAQKSYQVATKSYDLAQKRYRVGKTDVTDLNQGLSSLISSRQGWYSALREFWESWFEIRRLTLYDFEKDEPLIKIEN